MATRQRPAVISASFAAFSSANGGIISAIWLIVMVAGGGEVKSTLSTMGTKIFNSRKSQLT